MKLLYYSTAYHATHGGSIQSIEFYSSLNKFNQIKESEVYPKGISVVKEKKSFKKSIRQFLRKIPLLQVFFFYRKNKMYLKGVEEYIQKFNPDVIVLQIDSNFLQIKKLKSKFPKLIITTQVNASPFDEPFKNIAFKKYFIKKQSLFYSKADYNFFISGFLREHIMGDFLNPDRDKIIHNGTDISKFRPLSGKEKLREKYKYPKDQFIVGYIGTLDFHKKVALLLLSLQKLSDKAITLVIIGNGPALSSLKTITKSLGIDDKVIFKGWVDHDLMNEHLNCFDLAIHHHANEYMSPLKIFEYLATELPVIAPDIPAVREILQDEVEVVLTQPTVESITENILSMYYDEEKRKLLASNGANKIRKNFTWMEYTRNIVETIDTK